MDQIVKSCGQTTLAPPLGPFLPCLLLQGPCYDIGLNKVLQRSYPGEQPLCRQMN